MAAADRTLTIGSWTITIGAVVYSVLTVTPLMAAHTPRGWVWTAPILPIVVDSAVVIVVRLDAVLARLHAQAARDGAMPRRAAWPFILRWITGLMTLVLNVGDSALRGDLVGVGVHMPALLLLIVNAEASLAYRRAIAAALARIERERRTEEDEERDRERQRERLAREEREREAARREQREREAREHADRLAREEREHAERLAREQREQAAQEARERREHEQAMERERLASQERREAAAREEREQARRAEADVTARRERDAQERQSRERAAVQREHPAATPLVKVRGEHADGPVVNGRPAPVNTPAAVFTDTTGKAVTADRSPAPAAVHAAVGPVTRRPVNTVNTPVNGKLTEPDARATVHESWAAGLSVREAADITGWSVGWVSARYQELKAHASKEVAA
ncbi:hypothetical protein [Streptomyces sp. NPDC003077]|uniref:hypothetical protein n=1 Tax=Streptomyces sp. NPDC003077 TaxID=3154443 RepID=UPI0033A48876